MRRGPRQVIAGTIAASVLVVACSSFSGEGSDPTSPAEADAGADGTTSMADTSTVDGGDASRPPKYSQRCGPLTCGHPDGSADLDECCYRPDQVPAETFECTPATVLCRDPVPSKRYECDDEEDCAARGLVDNVCCATIGKRPGDAKFYFMDSKCVARPNCIGAADKVRRCNPSVAGECRNGEPCIELTSRKDANNQSQPVLPSFPTCPF